MINSLIVATGLLGLVLLYLLAQASGSTSLLSDHYWLLLGLNALLGLGLALFLGRELLRMRRAVRQRVFGAKLTLRMTTLFMLVAVLPGILVFTMSVQFLNRSIESWFNVNIETALDRGLNLGRSALDVLLANLASRADAAADDLALASPATYGERLPRLRAQLGVRELALFDGSGQLIAVTTRDAGPNDNAAPHLPATLDLDPQGRWQAILPTLDGKGLELVVAHRFDRLGWGSPLMLLATQPVPELLAADADAVEAARADYRQLVLARDGLKSFYRLTLGMTLLLSLFAAVAIGAVLSRRMSAPLTALAAGTRAVAQGDFSRQHPIYRRDELGILTALFNRMTRQLAESRSAEEAARAEIEANRAYLERLLTSLTAGVLAFDGELRLTASNQSAARILEADFDWLGQYPLPEWLVWQPELEPLVTMLYQHFDTDGDWQQQVELTDGRLLLVRASRLPDTAGWVVVFDDVTDLVHAQRDAAWREVARRLAHEIRNPLTPIQLSAERLAMKLSPRLDEAGADFLARSTDTIIKQVAALKGMVDAFRDYARAPAGQMTLTDLNAVVCEVALLYESNPSVRLALCPQPLPIMADAALLRQVIHNLVVNAQDATLDVPGAMIQISTALHANGIILAVSDNGPGFPPEMLARAFEPYVTGKTKGTGLGLAVVKKIIEEHGGTVHAENLEPHGARLCVTLPLSETKCEAVTS